VRDQTRYSIGKLIKGNSSINNNNNYNNNLLIKPKSFGIFKLKPKPRVKGRAEG